MIAAANAATARRSTGLKSVLAAFTNGLSRPDAARACRPLMLYRSIGAVGYYPPVLPEDGVLSETALSVERAGHRPLKGGQRLLLELARWIHAIACLATTEG